MMANEHFSHLDSSTNSQSPFDWHFLWPTIEKYSTSMPFKLNLFFGIIRLCTPLCIKKERNTFAMTWRPTERWVEVISGEKTSIFHHHYGLDCALLRSYNAKQNNRKCSKKVWQIKNVVIKLNHWMQIDVVAHIKPAIWNVKSNKIIGQLNKIWFIYWGQ